MAGPLGPYGVQKGKPIRELKKDGDWLMPSLIKEGPWTWVLFANGCPTDCIYYVVGKKVSDADLIRIAKGARWDNAGTPSVEVKAIPIGLEPIVIGEGRDDIRASWSNTLVYMAAKFDTLTVQVVTADPLLADLWGFWLDGDSPTMIDGHAAQGGTVGATNGSSGQGLVWAQDGLVIAVYGATSAAEIAKVAASLRTATTADIQQLQVAVVDKQPSWTDAGCIDSTGVILTQRTGADRWSVCFDKRTSGSFYLTVGWLAPTGSEGGSTGSFTPAPSGQISVSTSGICASEPGNPRSGTFVVGSVPPGSVTVDVTLNGVASGPVELADTGPRHGEHWFAAYVPDNCPTGENVATVTAKDAEGAVIATT